MKQEKKMVFYGFCLGVGLTAFLGMWFTPNPENIRQKFAEELIDGKKYITSKTYYNGRREVYVFDNDVPKPTPVIVEIYKVSPIK